MNLIKAIKQQVTDKRVDTSSAFGRQWLLQKMAKLNPDAQDRMEILFNREAERNKTMIGRFYFFAYDAKTKDRLPYWDKFPMVIPIEEYRDGFLGLNLHYIHPRERLILLTQLRRFATGPMTDERTRLRLSYPLLKAMLLSYRATPCIKRYLTTQVRSSFVEVPTTEWDIAAALPAQNFASQLKIQKRATAAKDFIELKKRRDHVAKEKVWKDSQEKM